MELFHVLSRGVDKRTIAQNDKDRLRFLHDLYVFNDVNPTPNYILPSRQKEYRRRLLVRIHAFCLMPNHYHLLLSPIIENGISLFMKKLNMGYAKYFNEKYQRDGALWQGKYKKILIARDAHFLYIPHYIHLNPLDLKFPEWRQGKVRDVDKALAFLRTYRWSSYLDYSGTKNFPSLIHTDVLAESMGGEKAMKKELGSIISDTGITSEVPDLES